MFPPVNPINSGSKYDHRVDQFGQMFIGKPTCRDKQSRDQSPGDKRPDVGHDHSTQATPHALNFHFPIPLSERFTVFVNGMLIHAQFDPPCPVSFIIKRFQATEQSNLNALSSLPLLSRWCLPI